MPLNVSRPLHQTWTIAMGREMPEIDSYRTTELGVLMKVHRPGWQFSPLFFALLSAFFWSRSDPTEGKRVQEIRMPIIDLT